MRHFVLAAFAFTTIAACQPATTELSEEQKAAIAEEVRQVATDYQNAWRAQENMAEYMSYSSDWAGAPWPGSESLREMCISSQAVWDQTDYETLISPEWEVLVLGPEAAAVKGTVVSAVTDTSGMIRERTEQLSMVFVRTDGQWKAIVAKSHVTPGGVLD